MCAKWLQMMPAPAVFVPDDTAESQKIERIPDAKCKAANLCDTADGCAHSALEECETLHQSSKKCKKLFDGTLGEWNPGPHDIELKPDVKPCHNHSFPTPS